MKDLGAQTNLCMPHPPTFTTVISAYVGTPTTICIVCNSATQNKYDFLCEECKDAIMYARELRKHNE